MQNTVLDTQKFVLANWKSHKTLEEAVGWLAEVGPLGTNSPYEVIVCPPFPFLYPLSQEIRAKKYRISLGIQDVSPFPAGAYTGAVCVRNLKGLGVKYALVGHSERRNYFHETVQEIANKVTQLIEENITPIVCIDREHTIAQANALEGGERKRCLVLYETVGHIGTGEVEDLPSVLRSVDEIHHAFGFPIPVIYGGSVSDTSRDFFMKHEKLAGVVVGTKSLDPKEFAKIIQ
ncbi:MAG: triosephosphate isomerase [Candidatus Pacebacteria bacterium]|nr:triosephosphate isomerase [Candidatus Paceibacterota bacterium]